MVLAAAAGWVDSRHEFQVVPDGDWEVWLAMAGRGSGKTRLGAEWTFINAALDEPGNRSLVAAPTKGDLRKTCFLGESGLLNVIPSPLIRKFNKTPDPEITLYNGAIIGGIAAENPERFRGPNWHRGWADELAAWGENGRCDPEYAWDNMSFSVRLGSSLILATTTPRNRPHVKKIIADKGTVVTSATTHVNLANLSQKFANRILKYDGTKIGRQEIYGELIDSEEGGIISRSWLKKWPAGTQFPEFEFIVMSLDTAYGDEAWDKKKQETDPSACSVWGCFRHPKTKKPGVFLIDCWAEYLGLPELVERVAKEQGFKYGAQPHQRPTIPTPPVPQWVDKKRKPDAPGKAVDVILIEEKASGKSLRQYLAKFDIPTYGYNPGNASKRDRTHLVSPIAKDGIIWVPESTHRPGRFMSWAEPLVEQVCSYSGEGSVVHDDLLDTATQAWRFIDWNWLHHIKEAKSGHFKAPAPDMVARQKQKRIQARTIHNPYAGDSQ
jgi:phage terminase large subunit-like protein